MFDWDAANLGHIAEHNVFPHEAKEAATYKPVAQDIVLRNGEERLIQIGQTLKGRILLIVSTQRNGETRIITAHDVDLSKRKRYALRRDLLYGDEQESTT